MVSFGVVVVSCIVELLQSSRKLPSYVQSIPY